MYVTFAERIYTFISAHGDSARGAKQPRTCRSSHLALADARETVIKEVPASATLFASRSPTCGENPFVYRLISKNIYNDVYFVKTIME